MRQGHFIVIHLFIHSIFVINLRKFTYTSYNVNCPGFNYEQPIKPKDMSGFLFLGEDDLLEEQWTHEAIPCTISFRE